MLEGAGVRCWIAPRDIRAGGEYGAAIIEAIDQCRVMVLIFSSSANESNQVHREIERAVSKGVPIVPVRLDEVIPTKSMEYFLGAIHWLDALTPPFERHLQQLVETVKAILSSHVSNRDASADGLRRSASAKPARRNLRLFALIGGLCVVFLAAGVWLYPSHVGVPRSLPASVSPQLAARPAETLRQWAGTWAGVWFVRSGKESTVTIALEGETIAGTMLWRETDDSETRQHRADGTLFNCKVNGNFANCETAWNYTDHAKDLKNHGTGTLTLDGERLTARFRQDEAEPTWRTTPYVSSMHVGAVWEWDLARKK
jgi:hypothetical protein